MSHLDQKASRTVLSVEHFESRFYGTRDGKPFATREYDVETDEDCDRILAFMRDFKTKNLNMYPITTTAEYNSLPPVFPTHADLPPPPVGANVHNFQP